MADNIELDPDYMTSKNAEKDGAERKVSIVQLPGNTFNDIQKLYDNWSETYDEDLSSIGYNGPRQCGEKLLQVLPDRSAKILDCASGTGLVAEELVKIGYTNLDAVDGSEESLKKASVKGIYKRLICDMLGKNQLDVETDTYDAIVNVGGFCEGHLKDDCLEEWIRIVKPGGFICILMREEFLYTVEVYKDKLEATMQELERKGLWKLVERSVTKNYYGESPGVAFLYQIC